jgi:hypothetical protein
MENVWNAFFLYSLILEAHRQGDLGRYEMPLSLPHRDANHRVDRYEDMLKDRNHLYSSYCRPDYNHACDGCAHLVLRKNGQTGEPMAQATLS